MFYSVCVCCLSTYFQPILMFYYQHKIKTFSCLGFRHTGFNANPSTSVHFPQQGLHVTSTNQYACTRGDIYTYIYRST